MQKLLFSLLLLLGAEVCWSQQLSPSDSLVLEGIRLHDEGRYNEALEKYDRAIKLDKENGYALYEKANTCIALKEYKKAIDIADKIIDKELEPFASACSLKGNALDMTGNAKQAIKVYRLGISKSKEPDYMLHFNLAIALLGQKEKAEAIDELMKALDINPNHASSHYYLGMVNADMNRKVKTLLPLYFFLLIEPNTERSEKAWKTALETTQLGVQKKSDTEIVININADAMNEEFGSAEMIISMTKAMQSVGDDVKIDSFQLSDTAVAGRFYRLNEYLFSALGETKDKKADSFWWNFYGDFFVDLHKNGHTQTFSYYIALPSGEPVLNAWFEKNEPKVDAFAAWYQKYWKGK